MPFRITDYIEFNAAGRANCPNCTGGKNRRPSLTLVPDTDGAYKCHRGCTPDEIREALGVPRDQQQPAALTGSPTPNKQITVSPQKVREATDRLMTASTHALAWLVNRGITPEMIARYRLGVVRAKIGAKFIPAISIPIPTATETQFYQKKRIAPWDEQLQQLPEYKPWSQFGIPQMVYFSHKPDVAVETWLCEGEWDAIRLGWELRDQTAIAVACFTCGAGSVPPVLELERMPGKVRIWYDRNDKPTKDGKRPGDEGAKKVAAALGDRGLICTVPMPDGCEVHGWDVSDALNHGYSIADFQAVKPVAVEPVAVEKKGNPLRSRLVSNDELMARAPDYTDWLVPDLFTSDELYLLAASPRAGKSLMAMTLAHAVATGGLFLDRPVTQGAVLYVRCEDSETKTKERALAQGWGEGLPIYWLDRFKLSEMAHLRELVEELDPRLIVLDTLSRVRDDALSESSAEMSNALEPLQNLSSEMGCCTILVHHTGKVRTDNADTIDVFDTIRGSSAIRAVCRGVAVLAAGERNYRLCVENGWGKHDLNVMLDANTLSWKLLGHWNPVVNSGQQELVIEYLKKVQSASIDQIHEATRISKASLYKVLERLQASEVAEEKVCKEGRKRSYVYRLALLEQARTLFDTIGQVKECQIGSTVSAPIHPARYLTKKDPLLPTEKVIIDKESMQNFAYFSEPGESTLSVKEGENTPSNPGVASNPASLTTIGQDLSNTPSNPGVASNPASLTTIGQTEDRAIGQVESMQATLEPRQNIEAFVDGEWRSAKFLRHDQRLHFSPFSNALEPAAEIIIGRSQRVKVSIDCVRSVDGELEYPSED